jgi:hypothetical protein
MRLHTSTFFIALTTLSNPSLQWLKVSMDTENLQRPSSPFHSYLLKIGFQGVKDKEKIGKRMSLKLLHPNPLVPVQRFSFHYKNTTWHHNQSEIHYGLDIFVRLDDPYLGDVKNKRLGCLEGKLEDGDPILSNPILLP